MARNGSNHFGEGAQGLPRRSARGLPKERRGASEAHGAPGLLDVVLGDERQHGVGGDADIECGEAGVEAQRPAFRHDLHRAIHGALVLELPRDGVGLLLLHLRLDKVEGQGEEGGEETCDGGGAKDLGRAGDAHAGQGVLAGGVEGQHAEVQRHGPRRRGPGSGHETHGPLLLHDEGHGAGDVGVARALRGRQHAVRLHADEREVRGVAHEGREAPRAQGGHRVLPEAQLLAGLLQHPGELVEEA
mmetsp:Transcript_89534/g.278634  ORF Transcript_89534/g.278634 Transcript_89534/m.278634 type:complete len:245 (+) Transcript_89534:237-971(+)